MSEDAHQPRISVLVPAYNAEATLGGTLTGLLTADYPDLEILVINDGSTDGTGELARLYESQWPEGNPTGRFVRLVDRENGGVARARNAGFEAATGSFLAFVDADDVVMPDYFRVSLDAYRGAGGDTRYFDPRHGRKIVVNNAYMLTPSGVNPGRVLLRERMPTPEEQPLRILQDNIGGILSVFPARMIQEVGMFEPGLHYCEDWDLWIRAVRSGWIMVRQDRPTALYRWTGGSASSHRESMYAAEDHVLRKAFEAGGLTPEEESLLTERLDAGSPHRMASEAETAMRAGDMDRAVPLLREAARLLPHQKRIKLKAWATYLPGGKQLLGKRQQSVDDVIGYTESMKR